MARLHIGLNYGGLCLMQQWILSFLFGSLLELETSFYAQARVTWMAGSELRNSLVSLSVRSQSKSSLRSYSRDDGKSIPRDS